MAKMWKKKATFVLCCIIVIMYINSGEVEESRASQNVTSDVIKEKEGQISQAEQEKKALEAGLTDIKNLVNSLETDKTNLDSYIQDLDATMQIIQEKLESLKASIEEKEQEIETALEELAIAEEIELEQYETMQTRIKFIYEKGDTMFLEMLFSATNFSDFLNKADYIEQLAAYDRKMLDQYMETTATIEKLKQLLLDEEELLQVTKEVVVNEEAAMDALLVSKHTEITGLKTDINNKEQAIKEYEANIAAQTAAIQEMEAIVAAERARILAENGQLNYYDGGQFAWPVPANLKITSEFGMRMHPILNVNRLHNGSDFACDRGTPIYAAYGGTVVAATYSNSMGNYVMIDHGDSLYTIYMHASVLNTAKGAVVSRGQKIAEVGTTGLSTGNHLHFSVRLNGTYVNPRTYYN